MKMSKKEIAEKLMEVEEHEKEKNKANA